MNRAFRVIIVFVTMLLMTTVVVSAQDDETNTNDAPLRSESSSASASKVVEPASPTPTPNITNTEKQSAESPYKKSNLSADWRQSLPHRWLTWLGSAFFPWWSVFLVLALLLAFHCRRRESRRAIGAFLGLLLWHCFRFIFLTGLVVMTILQVFKLPGRAGAFERLTIGIAVAAWIAVGHGIYMLASSTLRRSARREPQPKPTLPLVDEVAQKFIMQAEAIHKGEGLRSFIGATRTIALFGEWGSGKSTFLRQLEEKLSSLAFIKPSGAGNWRMGGRVVVPIFFDAWQAQSACPPEFALLNDIYANPTIQCLAWFTKPWYLRWLSLARSLRITIRGLSLDSTTQSGTLRRLELSLLSDAYRVLLDFLQQAGVTLVILIDESDRCDRLYFQGVLNLVPRYLNADNCFVVSAMVDSQLQDRLFSPLNAPESGEALLERYQLLAKEIDVEYAQPEHERFSGLDKIEEYTSTGQAGDSKQNKVGGTDQDKADEASEHPVPPVADGSTGNTKQGQTVDTEQGQIAGTEQGQKDEASALPVSPTVTGQQPRIMRISLKGDGLLERFEPDFYDTLRAAHAAGHASQIDLQRHFLAKFFEQQLFLAPPATNTPNGASVADIVNRLVKDWTQRVLPPKGDDEAFSVYNDLLELSTFHGGLGANPRLIISALGSVLMLQSSAARSVNYDLSDKQMKDFKFMRLLRLSLGLYCYLDRHPNYIMGLEAADSMRIADMLFAFASPESCAKKETVSPTLTSAKAKNQEGKNLQFYSIGATAFSYSDQQPPESLLACQVVFGIREDVADEQRDFAQNDKIRSLCNELCRVWTYSRRHLLSDTPADWDVIRVDRAWDVLRSGNPKRAIVMFDASIAALSQNATTAERRLALARALHGRGYACSFVGYTDDAIAAYDEVISRFGDAPEQAMSEQIALALVSKGVANGQVNRSGEAIAAFDEVIRRFDNASEPALRKLTTMALVNKGVAHRYANRPNEAIATYDEVVSRFGDAQEPELRDMVRRALRYAIEILEEQGRKEEAKEQRQKIKELFGSETATEDDIE